MENSANNLTEKDNQTQTAAKWDVRYIAILGWILSAFFAFLVILFNPITANQADIGINILALVSGVVALNLNSYAVGKVKAKGVFYTLSRVCYLICAILLVILCIIFAFILVLAAGFVGSHAPGM